MFAHRALGAVSLLTIVAGIAAEQALSADLSQPDYGVIFEQDVPIRTRDGTVRRADV